MTIGEDDGFREELNPSYGLIAVGWDFQKRNGRPKIVKQLDPRSFDFDGL
jgi:hypothetical protein